MRIGGRRCRYHTYTNLIFATLSGLGMGLLISKFSQSRAYVFWLAPGLLALPILYVCGKQGAASQRDHWFGWMYRP